MKLLVSSLFVVSLFMSPIARAALLIEPVVGYNLGTKLDVQHADNYSAGTGGSYGGRLGYQNFGLQLGLDYLKSSIDMGTDDFKKNISMSEFGAFAGFEFPILLRVYAGYIFSGNADTKSDNNESYKMSKESGMKVGIGFTGLPFVDLNIEYRKGTFDQLKIDGVEQDDTTVSYSSVMFGASIPLTF